MIRYLFIILLSLPLSLVAQTVTVSGYIMERGSGERLPYAVVQVMGNASSIATQNGFYSVSITEGKPADLCFSFVGFKDSCVALTLLNDTVINWALRSENILEEVTVNDERLSSQKQVELLTQRKLSAREIMDIPALVGEADVLKAVQMLPQVQSGVEGSTDLFVRGSESGQNLLMIDGVPVYNLSHTYGLFSAVDPNAVKSLDFYPGVAPARFSGRLSSYLDIHLREGNLNEYHGGLNVGLISSRLWVEGPLKKEQSSFLVSVRRSYLDLFFKLLGEKSGNGQSNLTDGTVKLQHRFSNGDQLFLSFYASRDNLYGNEYYGGNSEEARESWGNFIGNARWAHRFNSKLALNTSLFFSKYDFFISHGENSGTATSQFRYSNELDMAGLRPEFTYFGKKHTLSFGANIYYHITHRPSINMRSEDLSGVILDSAFIGSTRSLPEISPFIQDRIIFNERLELHAGLALGMYFTDGYSNISLQPRMDLFYHLTENITLHTGYDKDVQYLHQLRFSRLQLPSDIWIGASDSLQEGQSHQFIVGGSATLINNFAVILEGYYKTMSNIIDRVEGQSLLYANGPPENFVVQGDGRAYGAELTLERKKGNTTGWIAYTLAFSDRTFPELNQGEVYPFDYDRRHSVKLFLSHSFSQRLKLSGSWEYGTGYPFQIWKQKYPVAEGLEQTLGGLQGEVAYVESKNNQRLKPFHRLNLGLSFRKLSRKGNEHIYLISIYNVYSRLNTYYLYYEPRSLNRFKSKSTSFLPIVPMLSYTYKF